MENFGHDIPEPARRKKILVELQKVIDYRKYIIRDRRSALPDYEGMEISHLNRRVDGLYQTFEAFDGIVPSRLLNFLATLAEALEAKDASEAVEVRNFTYYLEEYAK